MIAVVKPPSQASACYRQGRAFRANGAGMNAQFDAYVTEAVFETAGAVFALGDGSVAFEAGPRHEAHEGAVLAAAPHPTGVGVITGGDDGRLCWSRAAGAQALAQTRGWIDAVAASPASGLIAFAAARNVEVRDAKVPDFRRRFEHPASVAALAFDPKGRRLAAATYGGVALWYGRIAEQTPVMLRWAGSHIGLAFSPDGRFLVSSMQEAALHGWRLADAMDMRMGGYPAKVKSLAFAEGGSLLATSGAQGVVLWPFSGAGGPMGKQAMEIGADEAVLVTRVAGEGVRLAAGLEDGRLWTCNLTTRAVETLKPASGVAITALAMRGGRIAWGDEAGRAGVIDAP